MRHSLRLRIIFLFILLLVFSLGGLSFYVTSYMRQTFTQSLKTTLAQETALMAEQAAPLIAEGEPYTGLNRLVETTARQLNTRVTIILPNGRVISDSSADPSTMDNHSSRPEIVQALRGQPATEERSSSTIYERMLYSAAPTVANGQISGVARLAIPIDSIEASLRPVQRAIRLTTLVLLAAAVLMTILLANITMKPIRRLTQAAEQMSTGQYPGRLPENRPDEVGVLYRAFNQMVSQLNVRMDERESERARLDGVLNHMTDGVLIVDEEGKVQLINPAAARIFNTRMERSIGRALVEVCRQHQIVDLWKQAVRSGEQQTTTLETNLERMFVQAIATPLHSPAQRGTLLLLQDLTRMRRLETVRRDFVSNVSHELRTPLASLKALAETLQDGALEDPPAARRFLARMEHEIDTLAQMVTELLELSRIESGKAPLEMRAVKPRELAEMAKERMQEQAERAGQTMEMDISPDLPSVKADPERMAQVLMNLLHNAIKFTPPGGKIMLWAREEPGEVVFCVEDTGAGISADDLPRIFERFYKADRARSGGGTGLGLSIARHQVETHGGKIWAESEPGKGSKFFFTLLKA